MWIAFKVTLSTNKSENIWWDTLDIYIFAVKNIFENSFTLHWFIFPKDIFKY